MAKLGAKILGGSIAQVGTGIAAAVDRFVETPDEKRAAEVILKKMNQEPDKWQAEINKIEAGHRSMFVAGWRPFIGWVCGLALAYGWIIQPIAEVVLKAMNKQIDMPVIPFGEAMTLVLALLGIGGMRSWEKMKGLTR